MLIGSALLLILIPLLIYKHYKYRSDIRKFDILLNNTQKEKEKNKNSLKTENLELKEEIVNDLLFKIEIFEKEKGYINPKLTRHILAKRFDTNSKYLSQVINYKKGKSYTHYINELRIDYSIGKLKTDKIFKNYSITAIAKEVGFNSSETFSKAFYKKTGLKPSFFIKNLEKSNRNS